MRTRLQRALPPRVMPIILLRLPRLPLDTGNGLSHGTLPLPRLGTRAPKHIPGTNDRAVVTTTFSSLLNYSIRSTSTSFFTLNNRSLLTVGLTTRLDQRFTHRIAPKRIVITSAITGLTAVVSNRRSDARHVKFRAVLPLHRNGNPALFYFRPTSNFT